VPSRVPARVPPRVSEAQAAEAVEHPRRDIEARPDPRDPEITLLIPVDDVDEPHLTILIPAVDEHLTIADFIAWCHQGLQEAGVRGEILIVDSSSDATPDIAVAAGARVLRTPRRGLGRAYIDAIPYVRGEYVLMGDADCTYDFRRLGPFVAALEAGAEFAMGSRWKGSIERGAMPVLHQYLGTPVTTWILNVLFGSHFSDIHCGMRAVTRDALVRMGLVSQSWEYASEMVVKSVRMRLPTTEVPVRFLKDRDGRLSHHRRSGWFSPVSAAWINLRAMFVHGAEFFLLKPGFILLAVGLLMTLPLAFGAITIGRVTFNLYFMLVGLTLTVVGVQSIYFGGLAQVFLDYGGEAKQRWRRIFRYNRAVGASAAMFMLGLVLDLFLAVHYLTNHFTLPDPAAAINHLGIIGMMFMIIGFSTFCFTLLLHATDVRYGSHDG
jgi:glycosyltransferase involved in cell wall biosynthesis